MVLILSRRERDFMVDGSPDPSKRLAFQSPDIAGQANCVVLRSD
jgi:hypothetical protein